MNVRLYNGKPVVRLPQEDLNSPYVSFVSLEDILPDRDSSYVHEERFPLEAWERLPLAELTWKEIPLPRPSDPRAAPTDLGLGEHQYFVDNLKAPGALRAFIERHSQKQPPDNKK